VSRSNPRSRIAAARAVAAARAPYFASALLSLVPVPVPGLGTIGVTARMHLLYDPEVVERWTAPQLAGGLAHEVLHVVLHHLSRHREHDPKVANVAQDLAVNPMVLEMRLELPPGSLYPSQFGWPAGQSADWYLAELLKRQQQAAGAPQQDPADGSSAPGEGGQPRPGCASGHCGSCAGHALPGEPGEDDAAGRDRSDVAAIRKEAAAAVEAHARSKGHGSVPGGLLRWAEDQLAPPKVRWQDKLAVVARSAVAGQRGMADYTYSRPSRRYLGSAKPGDPVRPSLWAPRPRVAIWADTSGSIGPEELGTVLSESQGVVRAVGAEVEFGACGAVIHAVKQVRSWKELPALLKGGGGTDFRPVFERLEQTPPDRRPDVLIFATDGWGPAPDRPPVGTKVIWLLVGRNATRPCSWGTVVEVEP